MRLRPRREADQPIDQTGPATTYGSHSGAHATDDAPAAERPPLHSRDQRRPDEGRSR